MIIPAFIKNELRELNIELTPNQLNQLAQYLSLILDANQRTNLTAIREPDLAWRRLMIDSRRK